MGAPPRLLAALVALVTLLAAVPVALGQSAEDPPGRRILLEPGTVEVTDGQASVAIGFGLLRDDDERRWSVLPLRIAVQSGDARISLAMNGLSLITRRGVRYGGRWRVTGVHDGDVINIGGPVVVAGEVKGDVWAFGDDITLTGEARVSGRVVALGGEVLTERGARVSGDRYSLPALSIPFLGALSSPRAAQTIRIIVEALSAVLFVVVLVLAVHFGVPPLRGIAAAAAASWKENILYVLLALLVVPLIAVLLIASIVGTFALPFMLLLLAAAAYSGLLGMAVWLGGLLRGGVSGRGDGGLLVSGLIGYLLLKLPVIAGLLLQLGEAPLLTGAGQFLTKVGVVVLSLAAIYGFGAALATLRARAAESVA